MSGGRSGHGHRRSQVPHHVKHPEKYTCYVLDEPLLVGGGDRDSGSSNTDQEKVRRYLIAPEAKLLYVLSHELPCQVPNTDHGHLALQC